MNKKRIKQVATKAAITSLTAASKIVVGLFEFLDDMEFMRSHQSLCMSMGVEQARAYLAETEAYHKEYRRAYNRLKKRGWIEERTIGGRMIDVLSESGVVAALEIQLKHITPRMSPNEYWLVVFDFPEVAHNARDEFRNLLKRIGFSYHQRSVWCSDKDVGMGMIRIVEILGINKWVRIYRSVEYR